MIRRFNFVGRQKLPKKRISIEYNWEGDEIESIDIDIHTDGLDLPSDAKIYAEAYHKTEFDRFNLGKLEDFDGANELKLRTTGYSENLKVRILIVNEDGIILRLSKGLSPETGEDRDTILPVRFTDIGQNVWRIDFQDDRPTLELNEKVRDIEGKCTSDEMFILSVYPAAIREVLNRIIFVEDVKEFDEKDDTWHTKWLMFAREQHPEDEIPDSLDPESGEEALSKWVDDVVDAFCDSRRKDWREIREVVK